MPRAPLYRPAYADVASGLRTLADLINDALMAMGTQPAFNGPSTARQAAVQASPVKAPRLLGRPSRAPRAAEDSAPEAPGGPLEPGDPESGDTESRDEPVAGAEPMDESHVETWRLVGLAQGGDGDAFGRLYDRYVDTVFRFIYFRVNDRSLAEDFTSETFLRALRRIGSISYQGRDIGAWFITIARNIVLDHMKSARHRLEITTADTIEGKEPVRSTEAAVLETLQSERLMAAVHRLGDEQRECVLLRFIQGLSVSETAAVMGKNDGAIKALQHRAVRKLADLIGSDM